MGQVVALKDKEKNLRAQICASESSRTCLDDEPADAAGESLTELQSYDFFCKESNMSNYPHNVFGVLSCGFVLSGSGKMRELARKRA